jgi:hypothetical protein
MIVAANGIALFVSGAAFGASIAHWYAGGGSAWGPISTSFLIAVIAVANLSKAFARTQPRAPEAGNSAV